MINKDFLKLVLSDKKKLLPLSDLRCVAVPKFDELSVKNVFTLIMKDREVMQYFPDSYPKGRVPDREYTFNVYHTIRPDFVRKLIVHAQTLRNAITDESNHA
jgi:hypothetical protein